MKLCSVEECNRPSRSNGMCKMHVTRWERHGDPMTVKRVFGDPFLQLSTKIHKDADTGCWLWTAAINNMGYGTLAYRQVRYYAHRFSYEMFVGPIPSGLVLDHLCRHPSCVNPDHLEAVTQQENCMRGLRGRLRGAA